jgi:outer membrane protein with beta-barrel domain
MKITWVVILLGCALAGVCSAGNIEPGFGVRAGVLSYNKTEINKSQVYWGGHGRLRLYKYFAAEASLQTREDTFQINQGEIKLRTVPFQISGMVYPLAKFPVSPYFVFGTGWYYFTATVTGNLGLPYVTGNGTLKLTENAPHIGLGVEAFLGEHVGVGADVRKIYVTFHNPLISNLKFNAYMVNIMGTFYF